MIPTSVRPITIAGALLLCLQAPAFGEIAIPVPVSPAATARDLAETGACPTFTWAEADGADGYELAVHRVEREGSEDVTPVLRTKIPGRALAWTPSRSRCLRGGAMYGWTVRAHSGVSAGPWSRVELFRVSERPGPEEVEEALEVLRRYREGLRKNPPSDTEEAGPGVEARERRAPRGEGSEISRDPEPRASSGARDDFEGERPRTDRLTSLPSAFRTVTPPSAYSFSIDGDADFGGRLFQQGTPLLHTHGDPAEGNVGLGLDALVSASPGVPASISGTLNTAVGYEALLNNSSGNRNVAVGATALRTNTSGIRNVAVGEDALFDNTEGDDNVAIGENSLTNNSEGSDNVAIGTKTLATSDGIDASDGGTGLLGLNVAVGKEALRFAKTGLFSVAVGAEALRHAEYSEGDVAIGPNALRSTTFSVRNVAVGQGAMGAYDHGGSVNTAVGWLALGNLESGSNNVALGENAGAYIRNGSGNIVLGQGGNDGELRDESNTIRIGLQAHDPDAPLDHQQTRAFIAGIHGVTVTGGTQVYIDSDGQLGTVTSSRRFKEGIQDVGDLTDRLRDLRPVRFRYKEEIAGEEPPLEIGLVAEEVAEVFPELVVHGRDGNPLTVRYNLLVPLLLDAVQEQSQRLEELERRLGRSGSLPK